VKDVGAAVEFILKRRGVAKLNLVGWSWGTAIMGTYTAQNDAKVNRLVLYAPLYAMREAPPISGVGAYRSVQRAPARQRGIPADRVEEISPRAWFDQWFDGNLATRRRSACRRSRSSPSGTRTPPLHGAGGLREDDVRAGQALHHPKRHGIRRRCVRDAG
jgi:pimeloyl-ACP methyl ester carboxylesterase